MLLFECVGWYISNHMFLWVWEHFQHDLYLVKCQDKHGVGGDLRLSRVSAPGNECLWRQRAEERTGEEKQEEKKRKKKNKSRLWFMSVLTVDLLLLSLTLFSLFAPHFLPFIFQSSLFSCLSLSSALTLAFFYISAHTNIPPWINFFSMHRQTATQP